MVKTRMIETIKMLPLHEISATSTLVDLPPAYSISGGDGEDFLIGVSGDFWFWGLGGNDILSAGESVRVWLNGGDGNDLLIGGVGNDVLEGGPGIDTMIGGSGDDDYVVYHPRDRVFEGLNGGIDTVDSSVTFTLPDNVESLRLFGMESISGRGNGLDNRIDGNETANRLSGLGGNDVLVGLGGHDTLLGGSGDDVLDGGTGNDLLQGGDGHDLIFGRSGKDRLVGGEGNDRLLGGGGNDILNGGPGRDVLTGGQGGDIFRFGSIEDSRAGANRDVISDFDRLQGDRIDLSALDANPALAGRQSFTFIGSAAFSADATGQLRFDASTQTLQGSTDSGNVPEFAIRLTGVTSLDATDLLL